MQPAACFRDRDGRQQGTVVDLETPEFNKRVVRQPELALLKTWLQIAEGYLIRFTAHQPELTRVVAI